jgi:ZIP family zinc transporter
VSALVVPAWAEASLWGLAAGAGLLLGAAGGYFLSLSHRAIAAIMAFGGGVLLSVLAFELVEDAAMHGGIGPTVAGVFGGAALFSAVNWQLSRYGARHRKRCGGCVTQPTEAEVPGSGLAIAVGALMDGIPESIVLGLAVIGGLGIEGSVLAGFFVANLPQGFSSAAGMKQALRPAGYIFGVWTTIVVACGVAAWLGYAVVGRLAPWSVGVSVALAGGGVLAMLAETMIPEAFEKAPSFMGLITATGFLLAFALTRLVT